MVEVVCTFSQSTGKYILHTDTDGVPGIAESIGTGWSGCGEGKNDPDKQDRHSVGPLPRGNYLIGPPTNESTGPYSLRLTPFPENNMFGRSGFLIHGPALDQAKYGQESHGCPILVRAGRMKIVSSGATRLEVVR